MSGLLAGKVVLVSGVGPDLGRSIALRSAAAGADLVLAARTASRLADVAKEVAALGRRAVTVPTDVTDPDAARHLAETTLAEYGRLDTLVHNAFAMPPMTPLADTDEEALRTAFDTNVIAALRLTRLLTPALAEAAASSTASSTVSSTVSRATDGVTAGDASVVMINSAVLRHAKIGYAGYKMAKSALLSMAQSLATELGPRGIRVNSVAPGWIWGGVLQWYFGHLAKERGVDRQVVYDETAQLTDLRRLPEPGQIADTVVFLASPMARAVTGQCLDVNCGEFHH